jgi:hypothetical protein
MEQMVAYLASEQGLGVRELLAAQLVTTLDQLQAESAGLLSRKQWGAADVAAVWERLGAPSEPRQRFTLRALNDNLLARVSEAALSALLELDASSPSSSLAAARKLVGILRASNFTADKAVALGRKASALTIPALLT